MALWRRNFHKIYQYIVDHLKYKWTRFRKFIHELVISNWEHIFTQKFCSISGNSFSRLAHKLSAFCLEADCTLSVINSTPYCWKHIDLKNIKAMKSIAELLNTFPLNAGTGGKADLNGGAWGHSEHLTWIFESTCQVSRNRSLLRVSASTCTPQATHQKATRLPY